MMKKLILLLLIISNVGCKEQDHKVIAVADPIMKISTEKEEIYERYPYQVRW